MTHTPIRLCSWNINGIRAAEKKGFGAWLQSGIADIVAIQETKASPEQVPAALREPPGYYVAWNAAEKKGYSGVATFSRIEPVSVSRGLGNPRFDDDGRVLISRFPGFVLYNIYFPNGGRGPEWVAYKLDFYQCFLDVVRPQIASGERVIVVGDANTAYAEIDLARPRENQKISGFMPEERAALGAFFTAGLIDTFRYLHPETVKYSWWATRSGARERNIGWRIDYMFVSANLLPAIVDADILCDVMGSDHCPVTLTLNLPE